VITEDQSAVISVLGSAATHGGEPVERIDTHSAIVFLTKTRAWKLKRAVRFDYLDFSTSARRKVMCDAEVRLNRRTAPNLYRGVVPITSDENGTLSLNGKGIPVDWVIEMARFDQDALFDRLAEKGRLSVDLVTRLARSVATFHAAAEPRPDHGGLAGMRWVIDGNASSFAEFNDLLDADASSRVTDAARSELDRLAPELEARRESNLVRQCHGDLHLRNIVLLDGQPTLFDAVEFNDDIACIDVLYDVAFLVMDLWRRHLPEQANALWNSYLVERDDFAGLSLLPLFLSCRAAVRAKTSATSARVQQGAGQADELRQLARTYLALAEQFLLPPAPMLVAIGGLSGSGKSTLARAMAPTVGAAPGAIVLRSDAIRKRLCGVGELDRLGPEGYDEAVSARVYATMIARAGCVLKDGHSVIADAVYARPDDRRAIARAAAEAGVPFVGLWLEAPDATLLERVGRRRLDPSDADAAIVQQQRARGVGPVDWLCLDASQPVVELLRRAHVHLVGTR
jgi:uncharacterized protein